MKNDPSGDVELAFVICGFWLLVLLVSISASYWIYTLVAQSG